MAAILTFAPRPLRFLPAKSQTQGISSLDGTLPVADWEMKMAEYSMAKKQDTEMRLMEDRVISATGNC